MELKFEHIFILYFLWLVLKRYLPNKEEIQKIKKMKLENQLLAQQMAKIKDEEEFERKRRELVSLQEVIRKEEYERVAKIGDRNIEFYQSIIKDLRINR